MNQEQIRTFLLIVIILTLVVIYLVYVLISFFFMHQFKHKIVTALASINVLLYQKYETLDMSAHFLFTQGYENPKLIEFDSKNQFKNYKSVEAKELEGIYNDSEAIYMIVKSVVANLKTSDDLKTITGYLNTIDQLNIKYFETIQLYNTYVVGYNYWRNLFFTKWIKVLFKKEEIDTIK
jgi:hypothetical protein